MKRRVMLTKSALALGGAALGAALFPAARLRAEVGPVMATLSTYMAAAKDRPLPAPALAEAIHHVLDTLAAMISGAELPPGQVALRYGRTLGAGSATLAASSIRTAPIDAALINGILAHSDETDDSHNESQSHPGAAVVPAALAMAEGLGSVSGAHFLRAVALGYDVGPRVTMALGGVDFRNETRRSTHSIAGTFGAAAAAGCVASLGAEQMRWLLDYASQQSSGFAVWERDVDHIEKGFVFGGGPARNGVTAAMLVKNGFNGVDDVFSGTDNYFEVNAPKGSPQKLADGLGERYEVARTDIKKWTVGSPIQAPLDAVVNLRAKRPFTAAQVQKLVVRLAPTVGRVVNDRDIPDISLQHMLAVMLLDGTASFHAAHDKARMNDPAVLRERAKIQYVPDEELGKALPVRVAVVDITLADGTVMSERVEAVRGTVRNPMTRQEIIDKSRDLIAPVLGTGQAQRLIEAVLALDAARDVSAMAALLRRG